VSIADIFGELSLSIFVLHVMLAGLFRGSQLYQQTLNKQANKQKNEKEKTSRAFWVIYIFYFFKKIHIQYPR
jgi:hypothetical protein